MGTSAITEAFKPYQKQFNTITQRAHSQFEDRDWHGLQADATERLSLYRKIIKRNVADSREFLGNRVSEKLVRASIKAVYANLIAGRDGWELAEPFYDSVTRQIPTTVGVDAQVEFVDTTFEIPPTPTRVPVSTPYRRMEVDFRPDLDKQLFRR